MRAQMAKGSILSCMLNIFSKTVERHIDLRVERQGGSSRVLAVKDLTPGELKLTAVVTSMSNIVDASLHPHALKATYACTSVAGATTSHRFYITPEFSLPKPPAVAGEAAEWGAKNSPLLFWGIKRSHEEDKWNCEVETFVANVVVAAGFNDSQYFAGEEPISDAATIDLPVIVNTRSISKNEEVVVRCLPPVQKPKQSKVKTWQTEAAAATKKPKRDVAVAAM